MADKLAELAEVARAREPLGVASDPTVFVCDPTASDAVLYRNHHARLQIDFTVNRLGFPDLQTMDPRLVRIAPGHRNELHRHAHESLFVVLKGEGEVRIGEHWQRLSEGQVAFVPRWIFHQTRNLSEEHELVMLAITDYGFTSAALGDYDKRTRMAEGGDQSEGLPDSIEHS